MIKNSLVFILVLFILASPVMVSASNWVTVVDNNRVLIAIDTDYISHYIDDRGYPKTKGVYRSYNRSNDLTTLFYIIINDSMLIYMVQQTVTTDANGNVVERESAADYPTAIYHAPGSVGYTVISRILNY